MKSKANVAPEFIGKLYQRGEEIWRLERFEMPKPEPEVTMLCIDGEHSGEVITRPLSEFKGYVRLAPVGLKRKYTRHITPTIITENTPPILTADIETGSPQKPRRIKFDVTKWYCKTPQGDDKNYQSIYGTSTGEAETLRDATQALFTGLGFPISGKALDTFLAKIPDVPEKKILVSVLKGE